MKYTRADLAKLAGLPEPIEQAGGKEVWSVVDAAIDLLNGVEPPTQYGIPTESGGDPGSDEAMKRGLE